MFMYSGISIGVSTRYMGRFRTNRFNPWTNLQKTIGPKKTEAIDGDVQAFKSEVGTIITYILLLIVIVIIHRYIGIIYFYATLVRVDFYFHYAHKI